MLTMDSAFNVLSATRVILAMMLVSTCIVGDSLLEVVQIKSAHTLRALVDNGTHGLVGLLSWAIVINPTLVPVLTLIREPVLWEVALCGILSSLLDLDHFLAAKSFKLQDALSLQHRPPFHATTIIPVLGLLLAILVKLFKLKKLHNLPLIFMTAWLSHHIRDATRRGLWFWPFGSSPPLPYWSYLTASTALPFILVLYMNLIGYLTSLMSSKLSSPDIGVVQHV